MTPVKVERPSSITNKSSAIICNSSINKDTVFSLSTIECVSRMAASLTEGRLSDVENQRAKLRIKIRPSVFVIETNKEYTLEEISTEHLNKIIDRRTGAFKNSIGQSTSIQGTKRRKICDDEGQRRLAQGSVRDLETVSELLPIIINVSDWNLYNEDEIRFDIRGNEGVEELVNASHLDSERWEIDRVTPLLLNGVSGIFYARYGIVDVVVSKSQVSGYALQNPIVFRLKNAKVWLSTPLQLAVPANKKDGSDDHQVLYQHPSLTSVEDLKAMAFRSKSVSALLIPGVTKFRPAELELLNKGGEKMHYFTAQCYMSKDDLTINSLMIKQHERLCSEEHDEIGDGIRKKQEEGQTDEEKKKQAEVCLGAFGNKLSEITDVIVEGYSEWHKIMEERRKTPPKSTTTTTQQFPVSFKRSISCFFGPDFQSISDCVGDEKCSLKMHLFPSHLLSAKEKRTFIVSSKNITKEIHNSGRFLNVSEFVAGFVPDVDIETLLNLLKSPASPSTVASILFYNNADISSFVQSLTESAGNISNRTPSLADAIVELFRASTEDTGNSAKVVGEIASAVSAMYRLREDSNCESILFPEESIMAERQACGRQYYWHDPVRCVVGLYKFVMDNLLEALRRGRQVPRDESTWAFMHLSVIDGILRPIFDAALKTGAWAIAEVRGLLHWIVEDTLLKYTTNAAQHKALALKQTVLDDMARLCVAWTIMQSGAEHRGLCVAFSESPPFIIEPGLSLENYNLTNVTSFILTGDGVVDRLRIMEKKKENYEETKSSTEKIRVVPLTLPSGSFFKNGKDLHVFIVEPEAAILGKQSKGEKNTTRRLLDYSAPRVLSEPQKRQGRGGFRIYKDAGALDAKATISKAPIIQKVNSSNDENEYEVDGVLTGLSINEKMEHINMFLPGMTVPPEKLPVDATRQANYVVKDKGLEAVFFEPLISSLVLEKAANDKRAFNSEKLFKECISPLRTGKIVIFPNKGISYENDIVSVASPGFDWLWRVMQSDYGVNTDAERFFWGEKQKIATDNEMRSEGIVDEILSSTIKNMKYNQNFDVTHQQKAIPSQRMEEQHQQKVPFKPSFFEIEAFLKQDFKNVLSTLMTRMTMIVSKAEIKIIKKVCESVARIISDSFYIALDPEQGVISTLKRISGEQNAIYLDAEGFGYEISRLGGANILAGNSSQQQQQQQQQQTSLPSTLETILTLLNNIGLEQQQQQRRRRQQQPPSPDQTTEEALAKKKHEEQMKSIQDSSKFTSRLIKLIRDDNRNNRVSNMVANAVKAQQRTPPYMISAMSKPAQPIISTSRLPTTEKPRSGNFSAAQYLFVPINPKYILTDMQWLECLSIIESATRDSAKTVRQLEEESGNSVNSLKRLLAQWKDIVDQITSPSSTRMLSSLKLEWLDKEATRIADLRERAEQSRVALAVRGKLVNIEKYDMVAIARSLADIDFYVKITNSWPLGDWREIVYSAINLASIPLQTNISRGIMAASQIAMTYNASMSLSFAEDMIKNLM